MPAEMPVSRDILNEDVVFILQHLRQNTRESRSMHMLDVRGDLGDSISLDFREYLKFLRKFSYVDLDREQHTLSLTRAGEQAAQQDDGQLDERLASHFAEALGAGIVEIQSVTEEPKSPIVSAQAARPPAPPLDLDKRPPSPFVSMEPEPLYRRGAAIGQGVLATVFTGMQTGLGLPVAVKELRDNPTGAIGGGASKLPARLSQEVGSQARLRHPGIVAIYDLDITANQPFAVLELCEGGNLRDQLRANDGRGLPVAHAMQAFGQLLAALAFIHDNGLVHQGIKPENVLFDRFGNAKIGDLGFARLLSDDSNSGARQFVVDKSIVSYLAPELMQPDSQATPSTDVYAAGIVLHELVTGHVPGRRSPELSQAVEGVPPELDELFDRMVADRAEDRYASAAEVLEEFQAAFPDGRWGQPGQVWVRTQAVANTDAPATPAKDAASRGHRR